MKIYFHCCMLAVSAFSIQNCSEKQLNTQLPKAEVPARPQVQTDPGFNDYWFGGVAELTSYQVDQNRYGEIRKAEQVNIFVTEDFSKAKHVKLDSPLDAGPDRVPVLKLNWNRRFITGIYDYSLMQSVFKPLDGSPTLKTTTTIQDWCGHVFQQYDHTDGGYKVSTRSYFESEGDQELTFSESLLEDELWTMLRLNPSTIPTGQQNLIPSSVYHRFRHVKESVQKADIQIIKGDTTSELQVRYIDIPRMLVIRFESKFPYRILGWEETSNKEILSKGTVKATWRGAYWGKNANEYQYLRDSLRLKH